MSKTGQARVLTPKQFSHLLRVIPPRASLSRKEHRVGSDQLQARTESPGNCALASSRSKTLPSSALKVLVSALSSLRKSLRCLRLTLRVPMR